METESQPEAEHYPEPGDPDYLTCLMAGTPAQRHVAINEFTYGAACEAYYRQMKLAFQMQGKLTLGRKEFWNTAVMAVLVLPQTYIQLIRQGLPFVVPPAPNRAPQMPGSPGNGKIVISRG